MIKISVMKILESGISTGWIYLCGIGFFTREVAREGTKLIQLVDWIIISEVAVEVSGFNTISAVK